jgi:hypothetical protein
MHDAPTIVADDEEAVEHTERNRWHGEEVHRRNRFPMVSKEGEPTFGRVKISRRSFQPTGDRSLGELKRCQRTTVSGVTTMRDCFHPDQNRRTTTQKSLSSGPMLGRGCRRFSTASCCRSTRFSNTRFPRLRKRRSSAPIQRRSRLYTAWGLYQINDWLDRYSEEKNRYKRQGAKSVEDLN